ncbi:MAG TPA: cation diffusion facilitator family transporter [Burkholderiales bacterium]|nr:cation diffusion facilitator family transporter [Burkholderiales bacterium]
MRQRHARVLWIVLGVNAAMFVIEGVAGLLAHSTALLADSLDMLGDSLVYGFSLFVLARSVRWQARAAFTKGAFMLVFGLGVLAQAAHKIIYPEMPDAQTMGVVGALALAANLLCFVLLYRHRADNLNMSSTWLCSRNDLVANIAVLAAAAASATLTSQWPDVVAGTAIAILFLRSAVGVLSDAVATLRPA